MRAFRKMTQLNVLIYVVIHMELVLYQRRHAMYTQLIVILLL